MIIKAVNESRLLKTIISLLLCLTVTAFTMLIKCVEVYAAFPLAIPLIGAGLLIVAGLLVMAGLSFESSNQATLAANQYYIDLQHGIQVWKKQKRNGSRILEFMEQMKQKNVQIFMELY